MENSDSNKKVFDIRERTLKFSVLIIKLVSLLPRNAAGFAVASQLVRCGMSIGANVEEAQDAASKKDIIHSLVISLKEARETEYWLKVIKESELVSESKLAEGLQEVNELIKILTTIVKRSKLNKTRHLNWL